MPSRPSDWFKQPVQDPTAGAWFAYVDWLQDQGRPANEWLRAWRIAHALAERPRLFLVGEWYVPANVRNPVPPRPPGAVAHGMVRVQTNFPGDALDILTPAVGPAWQEWSHPRSDDQGTFPWWRGVRWLCPGTVANSWSRRTRSASMVSDPVPSWDEWLKGLATPLDFPGMIDRARVWNDRDGQLAWEFLWTVARMFTLRQKDGVATLLRGQTVVHRIEL